MASTPAADPLLPQLEPYEIFVVNTSDRFGNVASLGSSALSDLRIATVGVAGAGIEDPTRYRPIDSSTGVD